jgi:hypothetical protein
VDSRTPSNIGIRDPNISGMSSPLNGPDMILVLTELRNTSTAPLISIPFIAHVDLIDLADIELP